jgi:hypothetical protein
MTSIQSQNASSFIDLQATVLGNSFKTLTDLRCIRGVQAVVVLGQSEDGKSLAAVVRGNTTGDVRSRWVGVMEIQGAITTIDGDTEHVMISTQEVGKLKHHLRSILTYI